MKFASGWGVGGVWDIAFYGDALALIVGVGDGNGRSDVVISMIWRGTLRIGEPLYRGEGDSGRVARMW